MNFLKTQSNWEKRQRLRHFLPGVFHFQKQQQQQQQKQFNCDRERGINFSAMNLSWFEGPSEMVAILILVIAYQFISISVEACILVKTRTGAVLAVVDWFQHLMHIHYIFHISRQKQRTCRQVKTCEDEICSQLENVPK